MLARDLIKAIEKTANPKWQADWDKSGMQIAAARTEAQFLAVSLDATPETIAAALDAGCDFILSHHPLSLNPRLPSRLDGWHKSLSLLLCANLPLYSAHTSLDVNMAGPSGWLGRALGLQEVECLEKIPALGQKLGYGEIGSLPEPLPFQELLARIMRHCCLDCAALAGPPPADIIRRVAYCGGSGASLLPVAAALGAELFITGDVKYHAALDAEIPVLDVGHHALEEKMMSQFALLLANELPQISVKFFPSQSPFRLIGGNGKRLACPSAGADE